MKYYLATSTFILLCTCLIGHAGTIAAVTVTLREGDNKPVVAETKVDLTSRVYLPLIFPDRRVWICQVNASYTRNQLRDSLSVTLTDASNQISAQAGPPPVMLFSGKFNGDFPAGEKIVVFRSGDTTLELEIQPEIGAGNQEGASHPAADPGSKSESEETSQSESGGLPK